jgi:DNA repair protein RecO (recombination protein O)
MNWQDEGYLLSKIKFRENAIIISVFTNNFGKISGIVYGGSSRKIRNFLQISNKIFIFYNQKNTSKVGYFKTELLKPIAPKFFENKEKTSALLSLTSILNSLLPESQPNKKIYSSLTSLVNNLDQKNWIILYIYWELNLIKELGFDTDLKNIQMINQCRKNDVINVEIDNTNYKIPTFLINDRVEVVDDNKLIRVALSFTRTVLLNKFFIPNNLIFPKSRILLENYFN